MDARTLLKHGVILLSFGGTLGCGSPSQGPSPTDAKIQQLQDRIGMLEAQIAKPQTDAAATTATSKPSTERLPPPETLVSFQKKTLKVIPREGSSEPLKLIGSQWLFRVHGSDDNTTLCIDDESHCIALLKLREQLYRPANDPLGILGDGKR